MTNGRSIIGFAHRGMPGRAPDNSVEGYRLALAAGARALEGDVWVSADGQALLDHDGVARAGRRSRFGSFADRGLFFRARSGRAGNQCREPS